MKDMKHPTADGVVIPVPDSKVKDWADQGWVEDKGKKPATTESKGA